MALSDNEAANRVRNMVDLINHETASKCETIRDEATQTMEAEKKKIFQRKREALQHEFAKKQE